ncbi:enoyl-ACP reductase FabI [Pokkaliibacter sp. CJK22405]|uniref:enoyl-ACP reductase FabI n=1 Tax=Pokkaliibacter sp. CJK22405 TaxID=3384615 RepID=UPI003984ECB6
MALSIDLTGKVGLVLGVANEHSIAFGCAKALREAGAEICLTYLNDKARAYVEPLASMLNSPLLMPCDVREPQALIDVFQMIKEKFQRLDFVIHSIAWSPIDDLHGRLTDSSSEGFAEAMDISCHSLMRVARLAEPLLRETGGGTILTMSYLGAERVVPHYNLMGPVKAALESSVKYLAAELGGANIRVHTLSPGPMPTRAASGIEKFDELLEEASSHSPLHRIGSPEDVGAVAAFLVSPLAQNLTGCEIYIDAGVNLMA